MVDLGESYETITDSINTLVSTQLSSALTWANVPGALTKVVSSPAGYVWGYNVNNSIYVCQMPCTGNWTAVNLTPFNIASVQDITTDSSVVYILFTNTSGATQMLMGNANNTGSWNMIPVPIKATSIFATNTYVWVQDSTNAKQKCAKPCTTGNWVANPDTTVTITSVSSSALYGKDKIGNAMKSDETLQTGWTQVSGLSGMKLASIVGSADQTALYGVDQSNNTFRCAGECTVAQEVQPVDTGGYTPLHLSIDPVQKQLWMTSTTSGDSGNVFTRVDTPDYGSLMNNLNPLGQQRDMVQQRVEDKYNLQTNIQTVNKQTNEVATFLKKLFDFDSNTVKAANEQASEYRSKIENVNTKLDTMTYTQPVIQIIVWTLAGVTAVYLLLAPMLGNMTHAVALVGLLAGGGYAVYVSRSPSNKNGEPAISPATHPSSPVKHTTTPAHTATM